MNRVIYISAFLFLYCSFLNGQYDLGQLTFTRYGIEDGLPNQSMRVIGQDSIGYVWLADPLTRFDGTKFKTFLRDEKNQSSGYINAISMSDDGQGNLLFSGKEGIYYYNTQTQKISSIPSYSCNTISRRVFHSKANVFWDLCRDRLVKITMPAMDTTIYNLDHFDHNNRSGINRGSNELWTWEIGQPWSRRYNLDDMTSEKYDVDYHEPNHGWTYRFGENGEVYLLSTKGFGLLNKEKQRFDLFFEDEFLNNNLPPYELNTKIRLLGNNCVWYINPVYDIVTRFDLISKEVKSLEYGADKIISRRVNDMYHATEPADGVLLVGTLDDGLLEIDIFNQKIHQYYKNENNPNSLISNNTIVEKKIGENTFLISGLGQGLVKAERKKKYLSHFIPPKLASGLYLHNNIRSIVELENKIVVGGIHSVSIFDPKNEDFSPFLFPEKLPNQRRRLGIDAMVKDQYENLLVIFWSQSNDPILNYLDYKNNRIVPVDNYLPEVSFLNSNALFLDKKDNFWVPTWQGIVKIPSIDLFENKMEVTNKEWERFDLKKISNKDAITTYAIEEDLIGNIWVGTGFGLYKIDPNTKNITHFTNKENDPEGLSHNNVRSLRCSSDGTLWIGTAGGGINIYKPENNSFERIGIEDGLPDNIIYTLMDDEDGNIWMGTNKGLCKYNPKHESIRSFSKSDGIQDYEYNTNAVCKTENGQLIFGGINGFNVINPKVLTSKKIMENLVFTSFKVNDIETPNLSSKIDLNHDQNFIKFKFNLLDYYKTDKIQYAYMMEGLDADWNYAGNRNEAIYPGLNPGKYIFKVKAANSEGQWSNKILEKEIFISKPWYNRLWFYLLLFLLVTGISYLFYNNRKRQKERIVKLRNRISQDLHDEIGSTLSSISLFGTVAQKMVEKDTSATKNMLDRINDSTTQVMESMNDIVWAINSENDKLDDLIMRIRAYVSELSDTSSIKIFFEVDHHIKYSVLDMIQKRNIYLIFKESLNNAFKYSKASFINIKLNKFDMEYEMIIKDDGIGFTPEKIDHSNLLGGNGLINMKKRATEINGKLSIKSKIEQGTEIRFTWNPKFESDVKTK